ncbi:DUF2939 domain-containing protein [Phenylobacterium sp.]|uniref:DUF2939 domain-containing protein n=1 Tax=Phenylobacterium sp. TaxID=1871053 RepID=UPI00273715A2|nr:DUF2939 domain-containing protein [Phenylobacterium sp.]MDP3660936.1 DUF2939 domain-containing protein [Phenylobacterium sp.]
MNRILNLMATSLAALSLAACASVQKIDAAGDVHALLVSIRDGDDAAFDAHVDRPALEREIGARMTAELNKPSADPRLKMLGALLGSSAASLAGDALIRPKVFRTVAEYYGYREGQPLPGRMAIAGSLKEVGDGRVCATRKKGGPCLLLFTQEQGVWRLSGFEGETSMLRTGA